ncbi:hypothetical protein C9374_002169 [Naegleria lovaniensis]|uniref:Uncharacterized protein n=1 Tax=Naegleria lovaniensis TaxID=51637 RepID=A0AA88GVY9_NAELO|nr:uncharacterized protein C9374_002169 [Naegleria lovaniensis]KAG2387134.1 hypothetical protein C9374_002169 [Naegleria lovaniensis]
MKALFKNFLPGSQNNRSVDDMINTSSSSGKKKQQKHSSTSTTTNNKETHHHEEHPKSRSLSLFTTNKTHDGGGIVDHEDGQAMTSSSLSSMFAHSQPSQQHVPKTHSQPPLSPQPNSNVASKQSSSSSILSSSSLEGNQTKSSPNVMEHIHHQQQQSQQPSQSSPMNNNSTIGSTVLFADMMMLGALGGHSPPSSPTSPPVLFSPSSASSLSSPSLPHHHPSSSLHFQHQQQQQQQLGNTPSSVHTPSPSSLLHHHHHHHHSAGFSEPNLSSSQQQKFNLVSSSSSLAPSTPTTQQQIISSSNLDYAFPSVSSTSTDYHSSISSPMMMQTSNSGSAAVPRPSGTQQLIEVLNRKKWRDLLCVVQNGSGNHNSGTTPSSTTSSAHSLVASRNSNHNIAMMTNNGHANTNSTNTNSGDDVLNDSKTNHNNIHNSGNNKSLYSSAPGSDSIGVSSTTTTPSMMTTTTSSTTVVTPSLSTSSLLMMNNGNRMPSPNSPVAISVISENSSSSSTASDNDDVGDSLINDLDQKASDEMSSPTVVHAINSDALNLSTSMMASVNNSSTTSSNSNIGATLSLNNNNLLDHNDEKSFTLTNSPNEAIFRAIILGGFLSLKDVLHSCDLVCKSWHLRISHSKENLIYFLPQLLSSIQVWEEKSDLQIKLATQIAWNLNNMEVSKRALVVLFGLYKRSLHKEKIFNRAVFKEVVKPEVPELLGQTDKCNMFYRLSSPTWFSPYICFEFPIYLYLAKRCLRTIEKKDGEFQHRVQVLLKLKPNFTYGGEGSNESNMLLQPYHSSQYSNVSSGCISPSMSPSPSGGRKLISPIVVGTQARPLGDANSYASSATSSKYLEISPEKNLLHHQEVMLSPSSPMLSSVSPTNTLLRGNAQSLTDMIRELKSNWFFVYGVADKSKSTLEDRILPCSDVATTSQLHQHHEKPKLVHERIIRYFSHFSLAKMKEESIFSGVGNEVESENFALLDKSTITEKSQQITANIEKCYLEMSQFVKDCEKCPCIENADPSLCECFDKSMTSWICELHRLGLLKIDFVLQYLFKLLLFTCCGPMYDRSELQFVTCHLHSDEDMDTQNEELNMMCADPTMVKSVLMDWIHKYHQEANSADETSSIYHYYLKVKYDCSGFNGAVDEESHLLTLKVSATSFEFVSYLFESQFCKGQPLSSLPLFVKKM